MYNIYTIFYMLNAKVYKTRARATSKQEAERAFLESLLKCGIVLNNSERELVEIYAPEEVETYGMQ